LPISTDDRELTAEARWTLWDHLCSWIARLDQGPSSPTLISDAQQRPLWLLPYNPGAVPEARKRIFGHLSQALEELFYRRIGGAAREEKKAVLMRRLNLILHRRRRAWKHFHRDLEKALRADQYHHAGVILMSHLSRLRKGPTRVILTDPADPSREMEIALDARLGPAENARRYFQRSRKARAALPRIEQRIRLLDEEIKELLALREDLAGTTEEKDLKAAENRLNRRQAEPFPAEHDRPDRSSSGATGGARGGQERAGRQTIGRRYTLPQGWMVLVGRNNRENDELTHRVARPNDLWLHAQGVPGSHVIIRRAGHKDVPGRRIIELAAGLAAHFSRARHSGTVPVIITEKRYVRKPRGSKPGAAVVEREKTLFVAPLSPERLRAEIDK
jgi:predicted ribosome quality control (RQC) complex YloA/Tae2 family protein